MSLELQQKLMDMQALLALAAQIGRFGAWSWQVGDEHLVWSDEVCSMLALRPGFTPTPQRALEFVAPAWRRQFRDTLRDCVRDGSPFDIEIQLLTARGGTLWARVICEAQWDAAGRVRRIQGACQDVTERAAAREAVVRLNARLEERVAERTAQLETAVKELEAFSYSIAHDLRAPLSSIDGFSRILEESAGDALQPRSRHYLARIRAGVRQMGELTDGLLSLAKYSRTSLQWERVDLAQMARTSLAQLREHAPQRAIEAVVPCELPVEGDPRLLSLVVGNLLGNAWKFTARQESARIEVGCEAGNDGRPVYFVRDNGAGFDMAHASRMFDAFHRLHNAAEYEGTGIGLAIVHKIVARHGGRIWARSAPGQGATFSFVLGTAPA